MHLAIAFRTHFTYPEPVRQSHNQVRAAPTDDAHQQLMSYRITTDPPARPMTFVDYWGTVVDSIGVRLDHTELRIDVDAVVETSARLDPVGIADVATSALSEPGFRQEHWQYLEPSNHVQLSESVRDLASGRERTVAEQVDALVEVVRSRLDYQPGSTQIGETVDSVLGKGAGVCQDYAHVLVALARAAGVPARYVSGYLYAADAGGQQEATGDVVQVQTHAWVELAVPGGGWISRDPTNGRPLGEQHVKIGHGRDYDDVTPVKGTYVGGSELVLTAGVEMRQMLSTERGVHAGPAYPIQRQQQQQ